MATSGARVRLGGGSLQHFRRSWLPHPPARHFLTPGAAPRIEGVSSPSRLLPWWLLLTGGPREVSRWRRRHRQSTMWRLLSQWLTEVLFPLHCLPPVSPACCPPVSGPNSGSSSMRMPGPRTCAWSPSTPPSSWPPSPRRRPSCSRPALRSRCCHHCRRRCCCFCLGCRRRRWPRSGPCCEGTGRLQLLLLPLLALLQAAVAGPPPSPPPLLLLLQPLLPPR